MSANSDLPASAEPGTSVESLSATGGSVRISSLTGQLKPGVDDAFGAWLAELETALTGAVGFLGVRIDYSGDHTAGRIVSIGAKFADGDSLASWESGEARTRLLAQASDPFTSELSASQEVDETTSQATEVVMADVPVDRQAEYSQLRTELDRTLATFPGFVSIGSYKPTGGDRTWTNVLTFSSEADLSTWRASKERRELVNKIRLVAPDLDKVLPTGFGEWFSVDASASRSTPAWKQAMVVLATLYAMVSLLNMTLGQLVGKGVSFEGDEVVPGLGLPFPAVVFVGNAVGTALLTWVLMPIITRLLAWFLDPEATQRRTAQGVVLLLAIYAVEVGFFIFVFRTFQF